MGFSYSQLHKHWDNYSGRRNISWTATLWEKGLLLFVTRVRSVSPGEYQYNSYNLAVQGREHSGQLKTSEHK